jgi:hypothetical protein
MKACYSYQCFNLNSSKFETAWFHLIWKLIGVNLLEQPGEFHLVLHSSGVFTVKSICADMVNENLVFN